MRLSKNTKEKSYVKLRQSGPWGVGQNALKEDRARMNGRSKNYTNVKKDVCK